MDEFEERFRKAFGVIAFTCNRFIVDHMRRVSARTDMEVETALLWGITAQLNIARSIRPGAPPGDVTSDEGVFVGELHPVRTADIVQVSGVPKETVRRKLEKLRQLGKIERDADGRWTVLRGGVDEATYQITLDTARRLLATAKQIETLLAQVDIDTR